MRTTMKVLVMGVLLACVGGCSDDDGGCDGSKRGCVQMMNTTLSAMTVTINPGGGSVSVPSGTQASPGIAWTTVDSTVGAQITFSVSTFNPGVETCVVKSDTWTDPSKPPGVNVYTISGAPALSCVNWCTTTALGCVP